jgi:hypothetical protein
MPARKPGVCLASALLLLATAGPASPCTILCARDASGRVLIGNNEDWSDPDAKVWFLPAPGPGRHGRVLFGFKEGWTQGGMNDAGLFFDWVSGFDGGTVAAGGRPEWPGNLCDKILQEATTVEEALDYYWRYHEPSFARARILLADASGDSAVVGWENGRVRVWSKDGAFQVLSSPERVRAASARLAALPALSVDAVRAVLRDCAQQGDYPTRYTNVYEPAARLVHIFDVLRGRELGTLDLGAELAKGAHYYDVARLREQMALAPLTDGKTLRAARVDPGLLPRYAGTYNGRFADGSALEASIIADGGRLLIQPAGQPLRYELQPVSDRIFFLPYTDAQLAFLTDAGGRVTGAAFLQSYRGDVLLEKRADGELRR